MKVIVALESRFVRDRSGAVWSATVAAGFWEHYLSVFDEVVIAARVRPVERALDGWHPVSRPGVTIHPIPYYVGPAQFIRQWRNVRRSVTGLVQNADAVVLRIPSQVAAMIEPGLRRTSHPYAVEVVGDPHDVFSAGAVHHPLRRLFQWHFTRQTRRQCKRAAALSYVTEHALQRLYPPSPGALAIHCSDVELPSHAFVSEPRGVVGGHLPFHLIFVGVVEQMYKAPDVLLRAAAICLDEGVDLELDLVGSGRHLDELKDLAGELRLGKRVRFHGMVPSGEPIRRLLDAADLFVLASRQEGLPRAMLEAMARALPCIGSTIGGIPELLPADDLVPPGDHEALATKIREVVGDPERMARMAARNLERSHDYSADVLRARREEFYNHLRRATETFTARRSAA